MVVRYSEGETEDGWYRGRVLYANLDDGVKVTARVEKEEPPEDE